MSAVFLKLLNMSIASSFLVLAVIVLRFALKGAPKWAVCLLWATVGLRLVIPFGITSGLSLLPSAETVKLSGTPNSPPVVDSGLAFVNSAVNPVISGVYERLTPPENDAGAAAPVSKPAADPLLIASIIWASGAAVMLLYALITRLRLEKLTSARLETDKGVFICDGLPSPFILGIFRPRIFIPSGLSDEDEGHILSHERAHIARLDQIWKPLGFLLLSIHWFNPLAWLAYALLCRDIELACDEKVIKRMDGKARAAYSETILGCSRRSRLITACPLAFGEAGAKQRVKKVLNYKKPAFWIIVLAALAAAVCAVCFLTNPKRGVADKVKCVKHAPDADYTIEIQSEDEAFLTDLIGDKNWLEGEMPGSSEYEFTINGRSIGYDPVGRVFFDASHGRWKSLNYEPWVRLQRILKEEISIPFELENAAGFSNDPNVRVGVGGMDTAPRIIITAVFDAVGEQNFEYGEYFCLYRKTPDGYERVPAVADFSFSDIGHLVFAHGFTTQTYSLESCGSLDAGEYRLYLNGVEPTDLWIDFTLSAETKERSFGFTAFSEDKYVLLQAGSVVREHYDAVFNVIWKNIGPDTLTVYDSFSLMFWNGSIWTSLTDEAIPENSVSIPSGYEEGMSYTVKDFDLLEPGKYRLALYAGPTFDATKYRIEFSVESAEDRLAYLKKEYPEYFGLKSSELNVYVCRGSYVLTDKYYQPQDEGIYPELAYSAFSRGISGPDMRLVLSEYDAANYRTAIHPVRSPLSSCMFLPDYELANAYTELYGVYGYRGADADMRLKELRAKTPEYFGLDTENGLDVYVWQMAMGSFSFGIMPGIDGERPENETWDLKGVDAADVKLILSTYGISPADIRVIHTFKPYSDYSFIMADESYVPAVRYMLFGPED